VREARIRVGLVGASARPGSHGIPDAYGDHREMLRRPDVDLVVVSVKVPSHFEIVSDALRAGKMVFSEWPLGNGSEETDLRTPLSATIFADLSRQ
jgi:predicted dehydrogenase